MLDYQKFFEEVSVLLPEKWERVAIYYDVDFGHSTFLYYIDFGQGYICYLDMDNYGPDVRDARIKVSQKLDKMLLDEKRKLPKEERWSVFTMFVTSDGDFNVEYLYDDISEGFFAYEREWEKKHSIKRIPRKR